MLRDGLTVWFSCSCNIIYHILFYLWEAEGKRRVSERDANGGANSPLLSLNSSLCFAFN